MVGNPLPTQRVAPTLKSYAHPRTNSREVQHSSPSYCPPGGNLAALLLLTDPCATVPADNSGHLHLEVPTMLFHHTVTVQHHLGLLWNFAGESSLRRGENHTPSVRRAGG